MPDERISALPSATEVDGNDLFPFTQVSDSITKKCTRILILTAGVGEEIRLQGIASCNIVLNASGDIDAQVPNGRQINFTANGATITIENDGSINIQSAMGKPTTMFYTPLTPADWTGSPASVWEALDRIAAVVSAGGAVPIP